MKGRLDEAIYSELEDHLRDLEDHPRGSRKLG